MLRRIPSVVALLLSLALLLTGCGPHTSAGTSTGAAGSTQSQSATSPSTAGSPTACPTSNAKAFAKTRFVLHTGEGFGAFHRYLYKPYKAGSFASGSSGRIKTFLKAGVAALFIKRQIRLASEDVKANPTLCNAIAAPLAKVGAGIDAAIQKLKGGDASGLEQTNSSISSIEGTSARDGDAVAEDPNPNLNGG